MMAQNTCGQHWICDASMYNTFIIEQSTLHSANRDPWRRALSPHCDARASAARESVTRAGSPARHRVLHGRHLRRDAGRMRSTESARQADTRPAVRATGEFPGMARTLSGSLCMRAARSQSVAQRRSRPQASSPACVDLRCVPPPHCNPRSRSLHVATVNHSCKSCGEP